MIPVSPPSLRPVDSRVVVPRRSRPVVVALLALLLVLLTGCVKLNADVDVSRELRLSGTMSVMMKKTAVEDLGESPDTALAEMTADIPDMSDRGVTFAEVTDDLYFGVEFTLDDVDPSQFTEDELGFISQLSLSEQDGTISMSMPNPVVMPAIDMGTSPGGFGGTGGFGGGVDSMRSMLDESVMTFTFPGKVLDAPGAQVDGSTASWDLQTFEGEELTAQAKASGFPWWILIVVGAVVLLAIAALVIVLIVMSRKKKRQQQSAGFGAPGAQYGAPGGQGYPGGPGGQGYPGASGGAPGPYGSGPQGPYGSDPVPGQHGAAQPGPYGSSPGPGQYGSGPQTGSGQQQPGPYGAGSQQPGPYGSGRPAGPSTGQPNPGHPGGHPHGGTQMPGQQFPGQPASGQHGPGPHPPGQQGGFPGQQSGFPGQNPPGQDPQDRFRPPRH